ncbi:N-6 DNA methylase [Candidatus Synechococcus spongiarum]|uniref:site-specific DNA-methyltransferase (adenine-specific) n=1 Tax=Candidatus Synechococcus spongiarum TaxID=431041 RepID=A0A171DFP6_9SYNE|nr:Type I restriction-modification system, DNA-methyltransferase subunit M (EC 2.1.1.72) [Candidatus Synechococcus spongiarum]
MLRDVYVRGKYRDVILPMMVLRRLDAVLELIKQDVLQQIAREQGKTVSTHLYGQEINGETTAICKTDLLLKAEGDTADNIKDGPEHSTPWNDGFPSRKFDFMLSNLLYGKSWDTDLQRSRFPCRKRAALKAS